jgi:hypothetical protein
MLSRCSRLNFDCLRVATGAVGSVGPCGRGDKLHGGLFMQLRTLIHTRTTCYTQQLHRWSCPSPAAVSTSPVQQGAAGTSPCNHTLETNQSPRNLLPPAHCCHVCSLQPGRAQSLVLRLRLLGLPWLESAAGGSAAAAAAATPAAAPPPSCSPAVGCCCCCCTLEALPGCLTTLRLQAAGAGWRTAAVLPARCG